MPSMMPPGAMPQNAQPMQGGTPMDLPPEILQALMARMKGVGGA